MREKRPPQLAICQWQMRTQKFSKKTLEKSSRNFLEKTAIHCCRHSLVRCLHSWLPFAVCPLACQLLTVNDDVFSTFSGNLHPLLSPRVLNPRALQPYWTTKRLLTASKTVSVYLHLHHNQFSNFAFHCCCQLFSEKPSQLAFICRWSFGLLTPHPKRRRLFHLFPQSASSTLATCA